MGATHRRRGRGGEGGSGPGPQQLPEQPLFSSGTTWQDPFTMEHLHARQREELRAQWTLVGPTLDLEVSPAAAEKQAINGTCSLALTVGII